MAIAFLLIVLVAAIASVFIGPDSRIDDVARRRRYNG
jgi:hypothetical protein